MSDVLHWGAGLGAGHGGVTSFLLAEAWRTLGVRWVMVGHNRSSDVISKWTPVTGHRLR